jgi:hypothetical protein
MQKTNAFAYLDVQEAEVKTWYLYANTWDELVMRKDFDIYRIFKTREEFEAQKARITSSSN